MVKISLCLIVKNEEAVLERCIESMQGAYDELVIVDTGSTDGTMDIIKRLADVYGEYDWIDDFAAARNHAFSLATGDWLMWVDADDILKTGDAIRFRESFERLIRDHPDSIGVNYPYIYSHDSVGTGEMPDFKYHRLRIVKRGEGSWTGRVHEYIKHDASRTLKCDDVEFHHYRDEGKGTQNTARNLRILQKVVDEASDDEKPRYLFYLGKEFVYNGRLDDAIRTFESYLPVSRWIPEKHRAMYELAVCYQRKGDVARAKEYAALAIALDEDYVDPYVLLGSIAYNEKRWGDVVKWMSSAMRCKPPVTLFFDYVPYLTWVPLDYLSIAYWNLRRADLALACVRKALEYRPEDPRLKHNESEFSSWGNTQIGGLF
jgi:glycosyltransferase involved in cell wall biosynthesis